MTFQLPDLPFAKDALGAHMSADPAGRAWVDLATDRPK